MRKVRGMRAMCVDVTPLRHIRTDIIELASDKLRLTTRDKERQEIISQLSRLADTLSQHS